MCWAFYEERSKCCHTWEILVHRNKGTQINCKHTCNKILIPKNVIREKGSFFFCCPLFRFRSKLRSQFLESHSMGPLARLQTDCLSHTLMPAPLTQASMESNPAQICVIFNTKTSKQHLIVEYLLMNCGIKPFLASPGIRFRGYAD